MLRKLRERMESEKGFTLIELLVVILIIGILAAIALPAFLSQQDKGKDASAKSDARNLVSQVESCYADSRDYNNCTTAVQLDAATSGLPFVAGGAPGAGEVSVKATAGQPNSFSVVAQSKANNMFYVIKKLNGAGPSRSCGQTYAAADVDASGTTGGGCKANVW